ncbi:stage II sporulation protein M [Acetonema longum]|uniref:Stage II sporulation protein M n=1 Tax=Acetonema longum DSM 6540 TaxID=1009370 RepID=F7NJZ6_9FIRM|nr:stage II sporulation protein M [Acetonema longum]EGO63643.1 stage II sporulation protein M [Acetonema longum DSM 6540]
MLDHIRYGLSGHLRSNIVSYFFMILIFVSGVVIGALAVKTLPNEQKTELVGYLQVLFQGLIGQNGGWDHQDMLGNVLWSYTKMIGILWILGFTIIGIPIVLFIIFTRGFIVGFTVGFLINEYIVKGLIFALVSVLPHSLLSVPAVIITGVSSVAFSLMLARRKLRDHASFLSEAIGYSAVCFFMLLVLWFTAFIEVYLSPVFMKLIVAWFFIE